MGRMTARQKRFCDEYLIDLNATQAAIRAGYSPKTAYKMCIRDRAYGIVGKERILNAVDIHMEQHKYDEVRDYLEGLTWDGKPRLDTLLTDYLGAEDGPYTRAVMRKSLTAAVARAMAPGTKYD